MLCLASLQATEAFALLHAPPRSAGISTLSCAASPRAMVDVRRANQLQASAADSTIAELEARLGRRLTPAETEVAREAVDSQINELEARFLRTQLQASDSEATVGEEQNASGALSQGCPAPPAERAGGAAATAAASWGSWRVRAPTDAKARAHHVLVDSEAKALSLLKEMAFGAEIASLAAEHSLCPSKDKGGDLGEFVPGDMAVEFDAFIFDESSPIGVPLGPVKTPFGYHVVVIDERTGTS